MAARNEGLEIWLDENATVGGRVVKCGRQSAQNCDGWVGKMQGKSGFQGEFGYFCDPYGVASNRTSGD